MSQKYVAVNAQGRVVSSLWSGDSPAGFIPAPLSHQAITVGDYLFIDIVDDEEIVTVIYNIGDDSSRFWSFYDRGSDTWTVDQEEFTPYLADAVANHRWNLVDNLTATVVADTYVEDGEDFVVDEENAELQLKVNAGTEASLFTKVHVTPNSPAPKSHEGYKFVNKNVIVTRDTFAAGLVAIDTARQPYFDAERETMKHHNTFDPITKELVHPFFTVQDAIDFFNNKLEPQS